MAHRLDPPPRIDPPIRVFALIILSCLAQVYALTWIDVYFRSLGVEPVRLDFWLSQYLATLAAFVSCPSGLLVAALIIFAWCRATGSAIRKLAKDSGQPQFVAECVEPLVLLVNLLIAVVALVGVVQPIMTVCKTVG